jgi:hypothetical protein
VKRPLQKGTRVSKPSSVAKTGLLATLAIAFLALTTSSASAATAYTQIGEITGPEPGESFGELKSESVAVDDQNGHIYVADNLALV